MPLVRVKALADLTYRHVHYSKGDEFMADPEWAKASSKPVTESQTIRRLTTNHRTAPDGLVKVVGAATAPPQPAGEKKIKASKAPEGGDK